MRGEKGVATATGGDSQRRHRDGQLGLRRVRTVGIHGVGRQRVRAVGERGDDDAPRGRSLRGVGAARSPKLLHVMLLSFPNSLCCFQIFSPAALSQGLRFLGDAEPLLVSRRR